MDLILNHTIVPARDKSESARFFATLSGLQCEDAGRHFTPVRIFDTLASISNGFAI
jgi:hypothetical protein